LNGPVFIVGVNGSGTTMLADSLRKHPELYMLRAECRVLPFFAQRYPDELLHDPVKRRALADEFGNSRAIRLSHDKHSLHLEHAENLPPSFAAIVGEIFLTLARAQGKERWGEKSPMNLQHLSVLAERIPEARFVHIFRDARDVAQSFHRRWKQEPRRTVYRWKQAIRLGREQGHRLGPGRYMEVCYETLTSDPERGMRRICEFLGLPFDTVVLESRNRMMDEKARELAQSKIIQNSGRWKSYFTPAEIEALEGIAGVALHDLGYEVALRGDESPSRAQLLLWKTLDRLHHVAQHISRYGLHGLPLLVRRVQDAFRQDRVNRY